MIAYNITRLFHLRLLKKAEKWYVYQLLSAKQYAAITEQYKTDFHTPNLFIRIGLFLFTWVSILTAIGLFALVFSPASDTGAAIFIICLLFSAGCIFLLEMLINEKKL